jgi:choline dehydrogenase-like flavoprotein
VDKDFDIVIIGSGIAGAICAWKLSENRKLKIAIVDAGDNNFDREIFVKSYQETSLKSVSSPYSTIMSQLVPSPDMTDSGLTNYFVQPTPPTFKSGYQRITGGSTWSWRGNTPRYLPGNAGQIDHRRPVETEQLRPV